MKKIAVAVAATAVALSLSACDKFNEQFQDAPISSRDSSIPAEVINFPDGYSNVATKCDTKRGYRIYVINHGNSSYGALSVVPDPNCK